MLRLGFVGALMNSMAEATMDFMAQDPANADSALQARVRRPVARVGRLIFLAR